MNNKLFIDSKRFKGESKVLSCRLPLDMLEEIDGIAKKTGRNRSEVVNMCLDFALDNMVVDRNGLEDGKNVD